MGSRWSRERKSLFLGLAFPYLAVIREMNVWLRIALYLVVVASATFCGNRFVRAYLVRMEQAERLKVGEDALAGAGPATADSVDSALTNSAMAASTNAGVAGVTAGPAPETTNAPAPASATNPPPDAVPSPAGVGAASPPSLGLYAAFTLGLVVVFALLVANDVSHYVATRTHRELYNEEGEGFADPEYDRAEQVWANGEHLEAVRLLREYLGKNPREVHVAFRIAEIYEKDLANPLAAALEYEEILQRKLSPERWAWAAIHLCNLYSRMNQPDKTEALLHRIVAEYGQTAAARKARERLGLSEGSLGQVAAAESEELPGSGLKLPPGFRPKKR